MKEFICFLKENYYVIIFGYLNCLLATYYIDKKLIKNYIFHLLFLLITSIGLFIMFFMSRLINFII